MLHRKPHIETILGAGCVLLLLAFVGCGGGSSGDPDGGDPPDSNGTTFNAASAEAALEVLAGADNLFLEILDVQSNEAATIAALSWLQGSDRVADCGVSSDSTIWVEFNNGLLCGIYEPDPWLFEGTTRRVVQPPRGKDGGEAVGTAVVMTPFAHDFGNATETAAAATIDSCFGSLESGTTIYSDTQVTVERFEEVITYGPGVLLMTTHGCIMPATASENWTVLVTGEHYPSAQMAARVVDTWSEGSTTPGNLREIVVIAHKGRHWLAVTPAFIATRANFDGMEGLTNGCKSVVFLNACNGAHADSRLPTVFNGAGVDKFMGWSKEVQVSVAMNATTKFFRAATDTCTVHEAYNELGGDVHDPGTTATLMLYQYPGTSPMMIRAQMPFKKDGSELHGYSVGVVIADGVTIVSCVGGPEMQLPECSMTLHCPGETTGSWNCVSDDDALITVLDFTSGRYYMVQKSFMGVSGEIELKRYDDDVISGTFNGTLGHWSSSNPLEDPPEATITITDGVIKHVGLRS